MPTDVVDKRKKGFFITDDELIRKLRASAFIKAAYSVIVCHADKEGYSYPSAECIAEEGGMSVAQAKRSIKELEARCMVSIGKKGRSNKYFLLDKSQWKGPWIKPRARAGGGKQEQTNPYLPDTDGKTDQCLTDTGQGSDLALPDMDAKTTSVSQIRVPGSGRAGKEYPLKEEERERIKHAFSLFIAEYPKQEDLDQAERAMTDLNPDERLLGEILQGVRARKAWEPEARKLGIFVPEWPSPVKFIRNRRWTDRLQLIVPGAKPEKQYIAVGQTITVGKKEYTLGPSDIAKSYGVDIDLCYSTWGDDFDDLRRQHVDPSKCYILRYRPDKDYTLPTTKGLGVN